jgi:hypothetical protein
VFSSVAIICRKYHDYQTYQGGSLDRYNELSGVSPVLGRCTRFIREKAWTGIMNCLVKARSWVGVPDLPGGSLDRYNELSGESPVLGRCTRLFRGEAWTGIMNCPVKARSWVGVLDFSGGKPGQV